MSIKPLNINNFESPNTFLSAVETLQQQIPSILDDFSKYYVFLNNNPNDSEYQQMFSNIKSNLNNIQSQLFTITNNIEKNTNTISNNLEILNKNIQELKNQNKNLKKKFNVLTQKKNSATELIQNYKQLYDNGYLRNWGLLLSIVASCTLLSFLFKKAPLPTPIVK